MKRFHVHVAIEDLTKNVAFYSELFGMQPTVERPDYAKWMIDDPRVNFAISSRGHQPGVNHLGFQAEDSAELAELGVRADRASGAAVLKETAVECCYAKGNKYWVLDPQGLAWEHFQTLSEVPIFGRDTIRDPDTIPSQATIGDPDATVNRADGQACCIPLHNASTSPAEESRAACCVPIAAPDLAQPVKPGSCC
jgi:catechol 2,3-dioxygenase-like lactoylglutathione lyase family enzyme